MAKCQDCNFEMEIALGCNISELKTKANQKIHRIKYGYGKETDCISEKTHPTCHDCNAHWGHWHHLGCDMENCPLCGEQFISCGHFEFFEIIK